MMTGMQAKVGRVHLEQGKKISIQVGYARTEPGPVHLQLIWSRSDRTPSPEAVSSARNADVVVAVSWHHERARRGRDGGQRGRL
jgi:beta-glucosidase